VGGLFFSKKVATTKNKNNDDNENAVGMKIYDVLLLFCVIFPIDGIIS
jgi:hypothetical protein